LGTHFILLIILLTTAVSIIYFIVITYIITRLDHTYFMRDKTSKVAPIPELTPENSPLHYPIKIIKVTFGLVLLVCGLAMLVLPGQGLITIVIALSLIPFPGKHKVERNLLARHSIRSSLNWIRKKANKPPFIFN
jgi:hypothetical protein